MLSVLIQTGFGATLYFETENQTPYKLMQIAFNTPKILLKSPNCNSNTL